MKKRKPLKDFISENRDQIDSVIKIKVPEAKINNEERRQWILNDEGLYNWARSEGVHI